MDLEHLASEHVEAMCFKEAYKHGRHGQARAKITDRHTKEHECDVSLRVDLLKGTLLAEKHTPGGEPLSSKTIDLFLAYE